MADREYPASGQFLLKPDPAVESQLATVEDLPVFEETIGVLSLADRRRLLDQARVLIEDLYVHRPLKEAMHGINPLQRLRILQHRLSQQDDGITELQFHAELLEIFISLRDLHTNYLLPMPFANKIAFLPFLVEECFTHGVRRYLVTKLIAGFEHASFGPGAELLFWNGTPIDRAVDVNGERAAGSNPAARHSRGLDDLTIRALRGVLPPVEHWVDIVYRDPEGEARDIRFDWKVFTPDAEPGIADVDAETGENATYFGVDIIADLVRRAKKTLFVPQAVAAERRAAEGERVAVADSDIPTNLPNVFAARSVDTPRGTFGYVRIFTFNVEDPDGFVDEFISLAERLPQNGLIVDVRSNGGGHIHASERLLQVLTPRTIQPEPTQFINTSATLDLCRKHSPSPIGIDLSAWKDSIEQAIRTGATYSRAVPITSKASANRIGQRYRGPVVLITDARCYSATDIFSAGFKDHEIGKILGVDGNTGAGGANVWRHALLAAMLPGTDSAIKPLPGQADMRVAIRRTLRVGEQAGTPVEDLGIVPDERHHMTENDILSGNVDLIARAAEILSGEPLRALSAEVLAAASGGKTLRLETEGLSRVDVYVDDRPADSVDIPGAVTEVALQVADGARLELRGFQAGRLVAVLRMIV